jgi:hypothetical protein
VELPSSKTLRHYRGSPLKGSPNTVYAVRYAYPNSAFGGTSHTSKTLYAIPRLYLKRKNTYRYGKGGGENMKEKDELREKVKRDFPCDPALQEVHYARLKIHESL